MQEFTAYLTDAAKNIARDRMAWDEEGCPELDGEVSQKLKEILSELDELVIARFGDMKRIESCKRRFSSVLDWWRGPQELKKNLENRLELADFEELRRMGLELSENLHSEQFLDEDTLDCEHFELFRKILVKFERSKGPLHISQAIELLHSSLLREQVSVLVGFRNLLIDLEMFVFASAHSTQCAQRTDYQVYELEHDR
jgi:hypothetical protein